MPRSAIRVLPEEKTKQGHVAMRRFTSKTQLINKPLLLTEVPLLVVSALHYKAPIERPLLQYYRTSQ